MSTYTKRRRIRRYKLVSDVVHVIYKKGDDSRQDSATKLNPALRRAIIFSFQKESS